MIPTGSGTAVVTEITDTVTEAWPVFAALIALSVGLKVFRRFTR